MIENVIDDWRHRAACIDAPPNLFVDAADGDQPSQEPYFPTAKHLRYCDPCPVRTECLAYALDTRQDYGIWGGLSSYQRRQLRRPRSRPTCVSCGSGQILAGRNDEVCCACGVSWPVALEG